MTDVVTRLREGVAVRHPHQRLAYRTGTLLVLLGLAHLPLLAGDSWNLSGPVSWRKPIVFGVSLGLAAWSAGWALGHLPDRRRLGWTVAGGLALFSVAEWALIAMQRWRGVASHFNIETAFDAAVFSAMGATVGGLTLVYLGLLVWAGVALRQPTTVRWAVLTGFGLLLVASGLGGDLITRGTAEVANGGRIPDAVTIGAAGSGKVAHAVGLHGVQVLGAIALLLAAGSLTDQRATQLMRGASIAYVAGFGAVVAQVYSGRALLDVTSPWTALVLACGGIVAWCGLAALRSAVTVHERASTATA